MSVSPAAEPSPAQPRTGTGPADPADPFGDVNPALTGDCTAMLERLYHFLDGELTEERRSKIQRHLDGCPSCFSAFDFEAELRIVVAARAQSVVPDALVARIRATVFHPGQTL